MLWSGTCDVDNGVYQPEPGSDEAKLADYLRPRDWLAPGAPLAPA